MTSRMEGWSVRSMHQPVDPHAEAAGRAASRTPARAGSPRPRCCASSSPAARSASLRLEALALVDRVVELAVGVAQLLAADDQLEALRQLGIAALGLRQRRHLPRVVGDEGRLDQLRLDAASPNSSSISAPRPSISHGVDAEFAHARTQRVVARAPPRPRRRSRAAPRYIGSRGIGAAKPRSRAPPNCSVLPPQRLLDDVREHLLGEPHHVFVVEVGRVELDHRELGVVEAARSPRCGSPSRSRTPAPSRRRSSRFR